ncbi:unnamed protein product [Nyctereutes procyonoides]|uniref:(raccoon dog) hypothetical protein n=1 Tax=Nyctereutes procyonoides TaxID=34880 RepID=A0A811Z4Q7_NYCPR|nr:unnamed protein product [Nyctereutes procyonoides]
MFSVPDSNGYVKERSWPVQGLVLQEVFQSVHSAAVLWLLLPSGGTVLLCFISSKGWVSKLQILTTHCDTDLLGSSEGGSYLLWPVPPAWLSSLGQCLAHGVTLETRDPVSHRAPCMEPASACVCASLSLSHE